MARVSRFEDLIAWQKARELAREVYGVTREGGFARDFGLSGQIQRAAVSIMSSIAEGSERNGPSEMHHFVTMAKASCAEVRSHLYIAHDVGYLEDDQFDRLMAMADEVTGIISGLRTSLDRARNG